MTSGDLNQYRKGESEVMAALVGCAGWPEGDEDSHKAGFTKNQYLRRSAQSYYREYIDFATYADGHTAENYRGMDGSYPNQGIHYPSLAIAQAGWIAYAEAMAGNKSLFQYRDNHLLKVALVHTKHYDSSPAGNNKTYRGFKFNGRFGTNMNYMTYSYFGHINKYYQNDELWKRIKAEGLPGLAPNITNPNGSGANPAFDGPGGWSGLAIQDLDSDVAIAQRLNPFAV